MKRPGEQHGVPYALDDRGQVADPVTAGPGRYTCLGCAQEVVPVRAHERRLGAQVVEVAAHFRHLEQGRCAATGESVTHRAFKRTLAERLRAERQFTLHLSCPLCDAGRAEHFTLRPGWWVAEEWPLGEHRLDVAVLDEAGAVRFGFEVRVGHEVPESKALGLTVNWAEVTGNLPALRSGPLVLEVENTNLYSRRPCGCGNAARSRGEARAIARERQRAREADARRQLEAARQASVAAFLKGPPAAPGEIPAPRPPRPARSPQPDPAALQAQAERTARAFVYAHVPDAFTRLTSFLCVVTTCPGCRQETVFFGAGSVYMVPTWSALVRRASPFHPWDAVCAGCGWSGPVPPGTAVPLKGQVRRLGPQGTFWYSDE